jgi:5-formyltetrahydrofolate cyclo-ligase
MADDRRALRHRLRAARRAVPQSERAPAAAAIDRGIASLGLPRPGTRISAFEPFDGEIDPSVVLRRSRALGCQVYFPEITHLRRRRMRFVTRDGCAASAPLDPRWLDLVLVPLVGFDARGTRLGMGAGFYDRHFAFLRHRRAWQRPRLLGVAFDVQRVDHIDAFDHDVTLWGVVTERGIYGRAAASARAGAQR